MKNGASVQQCTSTSTEYVVQKPCSGSNVMVSISKDEPTAFNFGLDDIRAMKLLTGGAMMITFTDGATLTINNFEQAKASFPFTEVSMADGTVMNLQKVAQGLAGTLPQDTVADLTILKPQGGLNASEFNLQPGKTYSLGFNMKDVSGVEQKGSDLLVTFTDGTSLTLHNFSEVSANALPPQMTLADGSVIPVAQLINVLNVASAQQMKAVEPAAGEEAAAEHKQTAVKKAPAVAEQPAEQVASAEQLAEIEPAAGTAGAAGGGYGFNSTVDPAGITGLPAIGPIGPTALAFGLPGFIDSPIAPQPLAAASPFATLTATDKFTFEDTAVNLQIAAAGDNPPVDQLTITITGIPAGWNVDLAASGGGTFNAATGTYTIALPTGQSYAGGPVLVPPANADGDIRLPTNPALTVTLDITNTSNGTTSTLSSPLNVTVDAVADQPDLAVQNVSGSDNVALPLNISAAVTDTDGSETLTTATLSGIPAGFTLSSGTLAGGVWTVNAADLSTLTLTAPRGFDGSFVVTVRVNNAETNLTDNEITLTNNTNFNTESFLVTFNDTAPIVGTSTATVDDTGLANGTNVATGNVTINYQLDTPGTFAPQNTFTATGSLLGGALTSNGNPVTVTLSGNTYTATANGQTVFTMVVNADGSYTFTQFDQLDHADGSTQNETIALNFTVGATDADGDTTTSTITINVLDDAPLAVNDVASTSTSVTGNVTANDTLSQDTPNTITQIVYNGVTTVVPANGTNVTIVGTYGTLTINSTGAYTYTSNNTGTGTDNFQYTLRDFDGDTSTAVLGATVTGLDTVPVIGNSAVTVDETNLSGGPNIISGTVPADFLANAPGSIAATNTFTAGGSLAGGALTSHGLPVTVTLSGNTYTGKDSAGTTVFTLLVNANGQYTFTQFEQLDHADDANPNDSIALNFTVQGTDADGDTDTGVITVNVLDDAPIAINDNFVSATGTATGNILTNDIAGQDTPVKVYDVTFGGDTRTLPTDGSNVTITNASGTLVINNTGAFTFTPPVPGQGVTFTYRNVDFDGDKSVVDANHGQVVIDTNGNPTITGSSVTVDETTLFDTGTAQVAAGTYAFNFGGDGQGAGGITSTGYTGPALTSQGNAVTVTLSGNTYTGTANGQTVFTMVVNTNGTYTFTQFREIDHPNANDANDALNLTFGLRITDADGTTANTTLTAVVLDDGPVAVNDSFLSSTATASGNIITNDRVGADTPGRVFDVTFGGETRTLPTDGSNVTISNAAGTLVINTTGAFTYTPPLPGQGTSFTYRLVDFDGDKSVVDANHGNVVVDTDATPVIGDSVVVTDETSLVSGPQTTTGAVPVSFFGDTPGVVAPLNSFTAGGSLAGGNLTSHGSAVTVTLAGNVYTGRDAGGTTVFTMTVNTDGTYSFTQYEQLDHANASDPNDIISLNFTVRGTDADGDTDNGVITVNVRDDAPSALDDTVNMPTGTNTATGNVLTNDTAGQDVPVPVLSVTVGGVTTNLPQNGTNVTINGTHGVLVINSTGAYTYTSNNTTTGTDTFSYTIRDYDGDTSSANLRVTVTDLDTVPVIGDSTVSVDETNLSAGPNVISSTVSSNFFADGPGTIAALNTFSATGSVAGGVLKSNGVNVSVSLSGNTYTGTAGGVTVFTLVVNANGNYTFTQYQQLDHADGTNPNDVINLNFTVQGTDSDGDTDTGTITVRVLDDAPIAVDDSFISSTATASGNILTNDIPGQDTPVRVYDVTFGGQTVTLNANGTNTTITNGAGTLVINSTGQFTYTPPLPGQGTQFTYHIVDYDNDLSQAAGAGRTGTVTVDTDGTPVITNTSTTVYENGSHTSNGVVTGNFFGDGPGTFITCGAFSATGSLAGGALRSGGQAVTVTNTGNGYVGTANGQTVFTLTVNADGSYAFNLLKALDHADASNPNDVIALNFEVCGRDQDGDIGHGTLTVNVVDGAPLAGPDAVNYCTNDYFHNGNLITGFNPGGGSAGIDTMSFDSPTTVYQVTGAGGTQTIGGHGVTEIDGQYGRLYVFSNGAYVYYATVPGDHTDNFTYYLKDFDGDTSAATLSITSQSSHSANASIIAVNGTTNGNDANNALIAYGAEVADNVYGHGGDDVIMTWSGNDTLHGGAGNDALFGEYGADILYGDAGADVFVADRTDFNGGYAGKFVDRVMDFNAGEGDVIDLSALISNGSAAQSAIDSYVRAVNQGADTMIQVNKNDGSGWQNAMVIANHNNMDVHALLNNGNLDV